MSSDSTQEPGQTGPAAIVGVNYDAFRPASYRGVFLLIGDVREEFFSGNPAADLDAAAKWAFALGLPLYKLSSVDGFREDCRRSAMKQQYH